jgi:carbamate kinase
VRYVVAVGGNALKNGRVLNKLSASIVSLAKSGNELVITHGNGPQVGALALHQKKSLAVLTRETQRQIGGEIRRSLIRADKSEGHRARIVYTHVLVGRNDAEFVNPTKPIGRFYSRREAERLAGRGFVMKPLLNGYRRVVPSPRPMRIMEVAEIERLLRSGRIVIAAGGGGIAVTKYGKKLNYAEAVIDKDLASSLLAQKLHADMLVILTNVDGIILGFHTRKARLLRKVSAAELKRYAITEHFEAGSMLPKAMACIDFASKTGKRAVIGNLAKAGSVFRLRCATVVTAKQPSAKY